MQRKLRYSRKPAIPASGFRFGTQLKAKMTKLRDIHSRAGHKLLKDWTRIDDVDKRTV
jgi:hypothetical protein